MRRRLAAILSADVQGYSRLMGENEEATVRTLTTYREVIASLVVEHHGRIVDAPGDNLLVEFPSAVDALECAVEIQRALAISNAAVPDHRRMEFRIGINLGDVIADGERIYGDGVNIAARVQELAVGGGVCVSGTTYDQIANKLTLGYDFLGEHSVKNIAQPVRVYRVRLPGAGAASAGLAEALELPAKPSIAVLPFENMSRDPDQEYFSDGIAEDLITDLSKLSGLFVIARNSSFTYKGKPVRVQQVGRELGVRYVLEGSVRKAGDRVRITAQLVDAGTGHHLWADRYDRRLDDVFAVQDEITQKIVAALALKLTAGEQPRSGRQETNSIEAYDHFLRGVALWYEFRKDSNTMARQMFERAIALDPNYAKAYVRLSWAYFVDWDFQWTEGASALDRSHEAARKAVALDDSLSDAHTVLGFISLWKKQHDVAIAELERAVSLDPNSEWAYGFLAEVLNFAGRPDEAIGFSKKAMRLDPNYPPWLVFHLAHSYSLLRRYDEAVAALQDSLRRNPDFLPARRWLAVVYAELGREKEARAEVAEIMRISPEVTLQLVGTRLPYSDPAVLARVLEALRAAGLRES